MTTEDKLNGSVDLLAKAIQRVFAEAIEVGVQPIKDSVDNLGKDMAIIKDDMIIVKDDLVQIKGQVIQIESQVKHHQKALDGIKNTSLSR